MKKFIMVMVALLSCTAFVSAQKYTTRNTSVVFNPNKDQSESGYQAKSTGGSAVLSGTSVAFLIPIKTCVFNNALLQEHFNDNYLETDKYPNGTYKGTLGGGYAPTMLTKDGTYEITSSGTLTLHGVTKPFSAPVKLVVSGKTATFICNFKVKAADYNIQVPSSVSDKILAATPVTTTIKFAL